MQVIVEYHKPDNTTVEEVYPLDIDSPRDVAQAEDIANAIVRLRDIPSYRSYWLSSPKKLFMAILLHDALIGQNRMSYRIAPGERSSLLEEMVNSAHPFVRTQAARYRNKLTASLRDPVFGDMCSWFSDDLHVRFGRVHL
jgi:hypothetical protein